MNNEKHHLADRQNALLIRNGEIDFFRFFFAIIILDFHFEYGNGLFKSGYLAVEFFFVLSGIFLMKHMETLNACKSSVNHNIWEYLKGRILRLYPSYFIICLIAYFIRIVVLKSISVKTFVDQGIWELLMLQAFGFRFSTTVIWYVSALIISSLFLFILYSYTKEYFVPVLFFVSFVFLSILYQKNQCLTSLENHLMVSDGLLRGIAEMGIGCLVYKLIQHLECFISKKIKNCLFIPEFVLLGIILFQMTRSQGIKDFATLVFIVLFIVILFLDESKIHNLFNSRISYYLGSVSYDFYLNQIIVIYLARVLPDSLLRSNSVITFLVFVVSTFLLSVITNIISKTIIKRIKAISV